MTPFTIALAYLMDKGHKAFQRFGTFVASAILPVEPEETPDAVLSRRMARYDETGITATREIGKRRKAKQADLHALLERAR